MAQSQRSSEVGRDIAPGATRAHRESRCGIWSYSTTYRVMCSTYGNGELPSAALEFHEGSAVTRIALEDRRGCYEATQHTAGQLAWAPCRHTDRKHRARHHGYPQGGP